MFLEDWCVFIQEENKVFLTIALEYASIVMLTGGWGEKGHRAFSPTSPGRHRHTRDPFNVRSHTQRGSMQEPRHQPTSQCLLEGQAGVPGRAGLCDERRLCQRK